MLALEHYPLELLQANLSNASWSWGPLLLSRWYGKPKLEDIREAGEAHKKHEQNWNQNGAGVVAVTVLHQIRGLSLADECKEIAREYRERAAPGITAGAIIIDGTGFFPALAQAILTGLSIVQKKAFKESFCRSDEAAAEFLAAHIEEKYSKIGEESLLRVLRKVRSLEVPTS